ncbi:hypothetical protein IE077_001684 [Cardiosporidium cionae]|uniref:Uncharacterized protein n=1 Tax=Cardiosporidium cionae TaxID=476202 RepID=A0ABQ7JCN6_9APIC|nr:hypothetical protein IE077_001684 [Cardiosporidium cionae]|eukprot:KAF8821719.1 hypothetical protein IE077_001684 [Cardiosporidium cionae]
MKFLEWSPLGIDVVKFSPKGEWVAVGHNNAEICIRCSNSWHCYISLPGDSKASIRTICWVEKQHSSAPSRGNLGNYTLISAGLDGFILVWNLQNFKVKQRICSSGGAVFDACVSPNNSLLAAACDNGTITLFRLIDDELLFYKSLTKHPGRILSVCWLSDDVLFGGTSTSTIHRYQIKGGYSDTKLQVDKLSSNKSTNASSSKVQIWCTLCLPLSERLVSGDSTGKVTFWDVKTCTVISVFHEHQADVLSLAASADELCVISGGVEGKITAYAVTNVGMNWFVTGFKYPHKHDIRSISLSPSGQLAIGGIDPTLCLFENIATLSDLTKRPLRLPPIPTNVSRWISFSSVERLVAFQQRDCIEYLMENSESVYSKPIKTAVIRLKDSAQITCSDLTADGQLVAVANSNGIRLFGLNLVELEVGEIECERLQHLSPYTLKFLNNDSLILKAQLPAFDGDERSVCMTFHPSRNEIAVFGSLHSYYIYNLEQLGIMRGKYTADYISQIPRHYLSSTDGPISKVVWLDSQASDNVVGPVTSPQSFLLCQTATALCTVSLNESEMEVAFNKSDEQVSSSQSRKWRRLMRNEDFQVLSLVNSRFIPSSLRNASRVFTSSLSDIPMSSYESSPSHQNYYCNDSHEPAENSVKSGCNAENHTLQRSDDSIPSSNLVLAQRMSVSETSSLSDSISTSLKRNYRTKQRYYVDRRFKFLLNIDVVAQVHVQGFLKALSTENLVLMDSADGNFRDPHIGQASSKLTGDNNLLPDAQQMKPVLFLFSVSNNEIKSSLPPVYNAKRYAI